MGCFCSKCSAATERSSPDSDHALRERTAPRPPLGIIRSLAGWGLSAQQPYRKGQVILRERPLITFDRRDNDLERYAFAQIDGLEGRPRAAMERLQHPGGAPDNAGRFLANGARCHAGDLGRPFTSVDQACLYETLTLVNHSCRPNAWYGWDANRGQAWLVAARDFDSVAEEITYCYNAELAMLPTRERRQEMNSQFGFSCVCPDCRAFLENPRSAARQASEMRRAVITRLMGEFHALLPDMDALSESRAGRALLKLRRINALVREEFPTNELYWSWALQKAIDVVAYGADRARTSLFARELVDRCFKVCRPDGDPLTAEYAAMIEHPQLARGFAKAGWWSSQLGDIPHVGLGGMNGASYMDWLWGPGGDASVGGAPATDAAAPRPSSRGEPSVAKPSQSRPPSRRSVSPLSSRGSGGAGPSAPPRSVSPLSSRGSGEAGPSVPVRRSRSRPSPRTEPTTPRASPRNLGVDPVERLDFG